MTTPRVPSLEMAAPAGLARLARMEDLSARGMERRLPEPAVWLATSKREPSEAQGRAIGERCESSFAAGEEGVDSSAPLSLVQSEGIAAATMIVLRRPVPRRFWSNAHLLIDSLRRLISISV